MLTAESESTQSTPDAALPSSPALFVTADLAKLFRVQPQTVGLWVRQGRLPTPLRIGSKSYWRREVIEQMVSRAGVPAMSPPTPPGDIN